MIKLQKNDLARLYALGEELDGIAERLTALDDLATLIVTGSLKTYIGVYAFDAQAAARNEEKQRAPLGVGVADKIRQIIEQAYSPAGGLGGGSVVMLGSMDQGAAPELEPTEFNYRDEATEKLTLTTIRAIRAGLTERRLEIVTELRALNIYLDL